MQVLSELQQCFLLNRVVQVTAEELGSVQTVFAGTKIEIEIEASNLFLGHWFES